MPANRSERPDGVAARVAARLRATGDDLPLVPAAPGGPERFEGLPVDAESAHGTRREAARVARRAMPGAALRGAGRGLAMAGVLDEPPAPTSVDVDRATAAADDLLDLVVDLRNAGRETRAAASDAGVDVAQRLPDDVCHVDLSRKMAVETLKDVADPDEPTTDADVYLAMLGGIDYVEDLARVRRAELEALDGETTREPPDESDGRLADRLDRSDLGRNERAARVRSGGPDR